MKTKNIANFLFKILIISLGFGMVNVDLGFALKPYMIVIALILAFLMVTRNLKFRRLLLYEKSWLIFMIVSAITVGQFRYTESNFRYILGFIIISIYYITITNLLTIITKSDIERNITDSGLIICVVTIIYYVIGLVACKFNFNGNGQEFFGVLLDRRIPRLISLMSKDPNITVVYMTLFLFLFANKAKENLKNKLGLILSAIIIILTFSRGAYIALMFSMLIVYFSIKNIKLTLKIKQMIKGIICIAIIVVVITAITNINILNVVANRFEDTSKDNGSGRTVLWRNAVKTFKKHPCFGIGINATLEYNKVYYGTKNYVHNTYLEVLSETGIIGFIPYLIFVFSTIYTSWKICKNEKKNNYLYVTVLAIFLQMIFLSVLLNEMIYLIIAILSKYYIEDLNKSYY